MVERCARAMSLLAMAGLMFAGAASAGEAFGPGEQSTYQVQYLGVSAGTAQITVGSQMQQWGQQVLPIVAVAKSDLPIYPIRDRFISYWNPAEQHTIGSDFYADENHKRRRQRIKFDHVKKSAQVMKQKEGEEPSESSCEVPVGSADIAAATFALRTRPFNVGDEYEVPVFTGSRQFGLKAKVEGKQTLQTPLGTKEVFRIRAKTDFGGKLASKRDMIAYFTTDEAHVPLRVEAEFILGKVVAELIEYKPGTQLASR